MHLATDRSAVGDPLSFRFSIAILLFTFALGAQAQNKCSATGLLGGEKFVANNCAVAVYEHSVAIWFNENPISAQEMENYQVSAHADEAKDGKQRTLVQIMFCPGGGAASASATAVKSIDLNTNHAKSPLLGIQTVVEAPKDFKVEKMTGEIKPGGSLTGKVVGAWSKTTFSLDFDVKLPAKEASAGVGCGR